MEEVSHSQLKVVLRVGQQQPGSKIMLPISSQVKWNAKYPLQNKANIVKLKFSFFLLNYTLKITQFITLLGLRDLLTFLGIEIQYLLIGDTS